MTRRREVRGPTEQESEILALPVAYSSPACDLAPYGLTGIAAAALFLGWLAARGEFSPAGLARHFFLLVVRGRRWSMARDRELVLIPLLCPDCGGRLPAEGDRVIFPCTACGLLWEPRGGTLARRERGGSVPSPSKSGQSGCSMPGGEWNYERQG